MSKSAVLTVILDLIDIVFVLSKRREVRVSWVCLLFEKGGFYLKQSSI